LLPSRAAQRESANNRIASTVVFAISQKLPNLIPSIAVPADRQRPRAQWQTLPAHSTGTLRSMLSARAGNRRAIRHGLAPLLSPLAAADSRSHTASTRSHRQEAPAACRREAFGTASQPMRHK
jgi:hypothetical protein